MTEEVWRRIMLRARHEARVNYRKRKVVGVRLTDAAYRDVGKRWIYVITCGDSVCVSCRVRVNRVHAL